jgi:hypothetical protein
MLSLTAVMRRKRTEASIHSALSGQIDRAKVKAAGAAM